LTFTLALITPLHRSCTNLVELILFHPYSCRRWGFCGAHLGWHIDLRLPAIESTQGGAYKRSTPLPPCIRVSSALTDSDQPTSKSRTGWLGTRRSILGGGREPQQHCGFRGPHRGELETV